MTADTAAAIAPARSGSATKQRILAVADELFYAQGIRATSADRIIDEVGLTKVTFYRHFRTKGDLVVAYLESQSAAEQAWITSIRAVGDPLGSLHALAAGIGAASCRPGFRGCAFINAAAEFPDPPKTWLFRHRWKDGGLCPHTGVPLLREEIGGRTTCWSPARQSL